MSNFDVEKIINGTPQKRFINSYKAMKENYSDTSAQDFYNTYSNEPLSFLLENSRMIFSEPYAGYTYYKEAMEQNAYCRFTALETEYDKLLSFMEENGSKMTQDQSNMYAALESSMKDLLDHTKNTRVYATYIKEHLDGTFEDNLSNLLMEYSKQDVKDESNIVGLFESVSSPIVFFTYAPYVMEKTGAMCLQKKVNEICENASVPESYNEDQWKSFVESVICGNKLSNDESFMEAMKNIYNKDVKVIFEYFMNTSLEEKLEELVEENVKESDVIYKSKQDAINNIFFDMMESKLDMEIDDSDKKQIDTYKGIAYEATMNILTTEYQQADQTEDLAKGYSILKESVSLDQALKEVMTYQESTEYYMESEDAEDVSDDDINSIDVNDNDDVQDRGTTTGKKPIAPTPKNKAIRIQTNGMDKDAKRQQKRSIREQKGHELRNAAYVMTQVPRNILNDIKGHSRSFDKMDDERRKKYMTEPGFRKKILRNLKVAILYGGTATINLALIPFTILCRHFSKQKDRRIRNELVREIQTEIKICDEKIADAGANNDQKEKYKLMRIRDKLDAEMIRVKVNSKYV